MGITTLTDANRYGLTLVLGGGEVKLIDMVAAYGVFAAEGVRHEQTSILRIEDSHGKVIEETKPSETRVLDPQVALLVSDVLSDNVARTPLYGANSPLYFGGRDVAAKTGTTNDKKDVWILGYTPNIVVGAWAGNNIPEPMSEISGLIITPMWRAFMDKALAKIPEESFAQPGATNATKPILNGIWFDSTAFTPGADGETPEINLAESIMGAHDILHYVYKDNPNGPYPTNPNDDPQYRFWEYGVALWKNSFGNASLENNNDTEDDEEEEDNEDN